ncbi:17076_t:CDS:1, partial [Gigaspora margarita]
RIKTLLDKGKADYQIVYGEVIASRGKDKLREYIEMKSKEDIFADYGEAIKDKELEAEKELLENDLE